MMTLALGFFAILANVVGLSYWLRRRKSQFDLIPNCLLTRWPVLFVTGKRSPFYFSNYWNVYPEFLAEHGYEVFHLYLPWRHHEKRAQTLRNFLKHQASSQTKSQAKFHFMLDHESYEELKHLLINSSVVASFQIVPAAAQTTPAPLVHRLSYGLHRLVSGFSHTVPAVDIGLSKASLKNAVLLLEQVRELAEKDATQV